MLKVSRILHAGYLFEGGGVRLLVDPLFETPFSISCHAYPPVVFDHAALAREHFDAIVISHYHDDHCTLESLRHLNRDTPLYMFCVHDEMFALLREFGFTRVIPLELGVPVRLVGGVGERGGAGLEVTAWPALDRDVDCILQITDGESQILNVVDSWLDYETVDRLSQIRWDLILWPFQTMLELDVLSPSRARPASREVPPEWLDQLRTLNPRALVPSSCQFNFGPQAWQNLRYFPITYASFAAEIHGALPEAQVLRLEPGESLALGGGLPRPVAPLPFLSRVSMENYDYDYDFPSEVPSLAAISCTLGEVTAAQREVASEFLKTRLIEASSRLEPGAEPYFEKPRLWLLRVYDSNGSAVDTLYRVSSSSVERLDLGQPGLRSDVSPTSIEPRIEWFTEIPLGKLVAALEEGESLTSLQLRINDREFSPEVETELAEVDLLSDPLLRVLYENKFASYQKAQLRRLKKNAARD